MSTSGLQALRIVRDALDIEPGARDSFIGDQCGNDAALREQVEALLARVSDGLDGEAAPMPVDGVGDLMIGQRLGPFRLIERIGKGGMGVVYRGERVDGDFTQVVAIKLIRRGFDFDDIQARFLRERRILARLSHPNLAGLIDGGMAADGRPWFAMAFVDGDIITRWCDANRLGVRARVRLFLDVCAAVQHAHSQLVVHRDLKPGNILVDRSGIARLLDFGIARLLAGSEEVAATVTAIGAGSALTLEYAAPEQLDGSVVGVGADVYSLGVILYELVTGVGPYVFAGRDSASVLRAIRETMPEPLVQAIARHQDGVPDSGERLSARRASAQSYRATVRGDLSRIVGKALAREPERRYATVEAFAGDLARWLEGAPVRVSGNGVGYRLGKFVRRNRVAVAVAVALASGLVATSVLALRSAWSERSQREAAMAEAARVTAVRDYTLLMFREAGETGGAANATARDMLARGAERIFSRFEDRPVEGQAIADNLADLYLQLGDMEGAAPLLERLLAWPGIEANPEVQARARYNLSQVEYKRGNTGRARELLDAAQAWWRRDRARHAVILNESRIQQAQLLRADHKFDEAIVMLDAMIAERRRLIGIDREIGVAFSALSQVLVADGRYEEAVARAGDGLQVSEQIGDTALTLALRNNRGSANLQAKHYDEAIADFRQVVDSRQQLYGRSPETAVALINLVLAMSHGARHQGHTPTAQELDDQIRLLKEGYEMAVEFGGEASRITVMARPALADTYLRAGRVDEAEPLAEDGLRIALASYGETSLPTGAAWRSRAQLRIAQHRNAEARSDLDQARAVFERMGKGGEVYLATLGTYYETLDARDKR